MATTSLWKIHSRLDHVVDYAVDIEKTLNLAFETPDLSAVLAYTEESSKTEQRFFVSGLNCSPETAYSAMKIALAKNDKPLRVLGYHGYQSFAKGEVTADTAHEIGLALAEEMWGKQFQVVVATHLNTDHFHNHFVVCSTSFIDGKRYNYNGKERRRMMEVSDRLCRENALSVIENPQRGTAKHYAEHMAEQNEQPTKRSLVLADIDTAVLQSVTPKQFTAAMEKMGYVFCLTRKHPTIKGRHSERAFRLEHLGDGYDLEAIKMRIAKNHRPVTLLPEPPSRKAYRCKGSYPRKPKRKITGFRALYYHYCYLLGAMPKQRKKPTRTSALLHEDIIKLNQIIAQCELLFINKIDNHEQLAFFVAENEEKQSALLEQRTKLRRSMRKENVPEKIAQYKQQIAAASKELKALRFENRMCAEIAERSGKMAETIRQIGREAPAQRKEQVYEQWKRNGRTAR